MGKKVKIGKQRRDVFYNLAKESGYRSRAAFKLVQLNRKFQFLEKTRVCVDLCAAPGGWLQVAQQHMPVSSLLIGIDLDHIKPIHNVQTFRCDITTEECRQLLRRELKTWQVDTFLHDGAPNVGKSWDYDAYMQNCLTLSALKLATEFLMKGGYFITKIFRSKDYNALIWVLSKLFGRVHATKPKASRSESAEIFVVCEQFLAPDIIDPKFFQPNYLFSEILDKDELKKAKKEFLKPAQLQKKAKAIGYDDQQIGGGLLHNKLPVSTFIKSKNHVELLSRANEIIFDDPIYARDPLTTDAIREHCQDIKLLNRKEILDLIRWQRKMRVKYMSEEDEEEAEELERKIAANKIQEIAEQDIETEESEMSNLLKKQRKKVLKERRKLVKRINLKMVHKGDELYAEDDQLFNIRMLNDRKALDEFEKANPELDEMPLDLGKDDEEDDDALPEGIDPTQIDKSVLRKMKERQMNVVYINKDTGEQLKEFDTACPDSDAEDLDDDDGLMQRTDSKSKERKKKLEGISSKMNKISARMEKVTKSHYQNLVDDGESDQEQMHFESDEEEDNEHEQEQQKLDNVRNNSLLPELSKDSKISKAKMFFERGLLRSANFDDDIEMDLIRPAEKPKKISTKRERPQNEFSDSENNEDDDNNDSSDDEPSQKQKRRIKLDANGLALGSLMVKSAKNRRDIMNEGWNRYTRGDEDVPSWFKADEDKHFKKPIEVPSSLIADYNAKLSDINIRTCKKVTEAKARKKRRALKLMDRLKKKTENITENSEMTEREKMTSIKKMYKKALRSQEKQKTTVIVARKGRNNMRRPRGVKGKFKVVDPRMKKDKRAEKKRTRKGKPQKANKRLARKPKLAENRKSNASD